MTIWAARDREIVVSDNEVSHNSTVRDSSARGDVQVSFPGTGRIYPTECIGAHTMILWANDNNLGGVITKNQHCYM